MKLREDDGRWLLEPSATVRAAGVIVTSGAVRGAGGCEGGGMAAFAATSRAFCSAFSAAAASASACFWFLSLRASAARSRFNRASRSLRSFSASASVSASSSSSRVRFRADLFGDLLACLALGSSPYSLPSSPLVPWSSLCSSDSAAARGAAWTFGGAGGGGGGVAVVALEPALAALVWSLTRRRASAATLSFLTVERILAAAVETFPPPPIWARSGSWVMGEPYEVLYLIGMGVWANPPRAGVCPFLFGIGEGLAVPRVERRTAGMVTRISAASCDSVAKPCELAGDCRELVIMSAMVANCERLNSGSGMVKIAIGNNTR